MMANNYYEITFGIILIFMLFILFGQFRYQKTTTRNQNNFDRHYHTRSRDRHNYLKFPVVGLIKNMNMKAEYHSLNPDFNGDLNDLSKYVHKKIKYVLSPYKRISDQSVKIRSIKEFIEHGLPLEIDWSKRNATTSIHSQGVCASCYAHSVIEMIETLLAIKLNLTKPISLSVQQMIDCADREENYGCAGGDSCFLLDWLKNSNISILPETFYDKLGNNLSKCNISTEQIKMENVKAVQVINYTCLNFVDYEFELLSLIATTGPVAASVNGILWNNYLGGIIKYHCNGPSNHAVQVIGYNLNCNEPYYIVRNSWGTDFGINGYAKILFGQNVCNIATEVSIANIELI